MSSWTYNNRMQPQGQEQYGNHYYNDKNATMNNRNYSYGESDENYTAEGGEESLENHGSNISNRGHYGTMPRYSDLDPNVKAQMRKEEREQKKTRDRCIKYFLACERTLRENVPFDLEKGEREEKAEEGKEEEGKDGKGKQGVTTSAILAQHQLMVKEVLGGFCTELSKNLKYKSTTGSKNNFFGNQKGGKEEQGMGLQLLCGHASVCKAVESCIYYSYEYHDVEHLEAFFSIFLGSMHLLILSASASHVLEVLFCCAIEQCAKEEEGEEEEDDDQAGGKNSNNLRPLLQKGISEICEYISDFVTLGSSAAANGEGGAFQSVSSILCACRAFSNIVLMLVGQHHCLKLPRKYFSSTNSGPSEGGGNTSSRQKGVLQQLHDKVLQYQQILSVTHQESGQGDFVIRRRQCLFKEELREMYKAFLKALLRSSSTSHQKGESEEELIVSKAIYSSALDPSLTLICQSFIMATLSSVKEIKKIFFNKNLLPLLSSLLSAASDTVDIQKEEDIDETTGSGCGIGVFVFQRCFTLSLALLSANGEVRKEGEKTRLERNENGEEVESWSQKAVREGTHIYESLLTAMGIHNETSSNAIGEAQNDAAPLISAKKEKHVKRGGGGGKIFSSSTTSSSEAMQRKKNPYLDHPSIGPYILADAIRCAPNVKYLELLWNNFLQWRLDNYLQSLSLNNTKAEHPYDIVLMQLLTKCNARRRSTSSGDGTSLLQYGPSLGATTFLPGKNSKQQLLFIPIPSAFKNEICQAIFSSAKKITAKGPAHYLLMDCYLKTLKGEIDETEGEDYSKEGKAQQRAPTVPQQPSGSRIINMAPQLCTELLAFGKPIASLFVNSFDKIRTDDLVTAAMDAQGSRVLQHYIVVLAAAPESANTSKSAAFRQSLKERKTGEQGQPSGVGEKRKRNESGLADHDSSPPANATSSLPSQGNDAGGPLHHFFRRFLPHFPSISQNKFGSYFVEVFYEFGSLFIKEGIVSALAAQYHDVLKNDFFASKVCAKCCVEQFLFRPEEWRKMAERKASVKRMMLKILAVTE